MTTMKYTIDAADKKIGRIASEAASCLMGKKTVTFARNNVADAKVETINARRAYITAKKKQGGKGDDYITYTGHRGGIYSETLGELMARRGMKEVFSRAVYSMLPKNKLRAERMKNLTVKE
jgi:large subunit ribosomal protein L13